jgi:hypothetical protein
MTGTDQLTDTTDVFSTLHTLALRGSVPELHAGSGALLVAGLIQATTAGYELTALGHARHRALLELERRTLNRAVLSLACARLPSATSELKELVLEWERGGVVERRRLLPRLWALLDDVDSIIGRSAALVPRFAGYGTRLATARRSLPVSDLEQAGGESLQALLAVWREMNEDFLQTLGCAHDQDDL